MPARVAAIHPLGAIEGGRITIEGTGFPVDGPSLPEVRVGGLPARLVYASPTELATRAAPSPRRVIVRLISGSLSLLSLCVP